jgi:hypothetical protein
MSYGDVLMVGLNACADAVPDPGTVARGMVAELAELAELAAADTPGDGRVS